VVQPGTRDDVVQYCFHANRLEIHDDQAGLQPGGIEQVFNQFLEAIRLLINDLQKFLLGVGIPLLVCPQQGGGIPLDKPQRIPNFVGKSRYEISLDAQRLAQ